MQCPNCQTLNPANANYCLGCGKLLIEGKVCPGCQTPLPVHANFCYRCGSMQMNRAVAGTQVTHSQLPSTQTMTQSAPMITPPNETQIFAIPSMTMMSNTIESLVLPETRLNQLPPARPLRQMLESFKAYLPKSLYNPLERRPSEKDLQRVRDHLSRLLTTTKTYLPLPVVLDPHAPSDIYGKMERGVFLFSDVSGFTPLNEKLRSYGQAGSEQVTALMNDLFSELVKILYAHGGSLLKYGGDALLGVFPAETDEQMRENALHAVQAAWAIQQSMDKFARREIMGVKVALAIKCGVSAGDYFAAHIGNARHMSYVTTGHTVNRAELAEGHCKAGDIVVAPEVHALLDERVQSEALEDKYHIIRGVEALATAMPIPIADEPPDGEINAQLSYLIDRLDKLTHYLPDEMVDRMTNNPGEIQIEPENRPVTIIFANYLGISDLIEDMGMSHPEIITHRLNDYFTAMLEIMARYDGLLARMDQYAIGDRIIVFFGAPHAHEDDPVRAVYTALEMQKAVREKFSALQTSKGIYRFRQRIGINTGQLYAGNAGAAGLRQEYTLMGDDINTSARLMSNAEWGEILITRRTRDSVSAYFELKDKGELKVKGKNILIPTYQVLRERQKLGEVRGVGGKVSPLIGRENHFETLKSVTNGILNRHSQVLTIIGDNGLGKTRLLTELRRWLSEQEGAENVLWLTTQAMSFGEQINFWLAAQILRAAFGFKESENPDEQLFRLWSRCEDLLGKDMARDAIPFLAHLLALELENHLGDWVLELDATMRQKQTFWAVREFFAALAQKQAIVIALDDIHWADEASLALMSDLMEISLQAPILFIFAMRPKREKRSWQLRDHANSAFHHLYTEISLSPLPESYSRQLLKALLPGAELTEKAMRTICEKAAGNPFYIEEVVRSLIDTEVVVPNPAEQAMWQVTSKIDNIKVPDSLHAVITAHIDRLPEEARQILQMAAVVGKNFDTIIVSALAGNEQKTTLALAQLERSELIAPLRPNERRFYYFPQGMVQEVGYSNLRVKRRQSLHHKVGLFLEERFREQLASGDLDHVLDHDGSGTLEPFIEILAYHYRLSDDKEKAIQYLEVVGHRAEIEAAQETAVQHYTELLALIPSLESNWEKRYDILKRRQNLYRALGKAALREQDLQSMLAIAIENKRTASVGRVLVKTVDLYLTTGRYDEAITLGKEALSQAPEEDKIGKSRILYYLGELDYLKGNYDEAIERLHQAMRLQEQLDDHAALAQSIMVMGKIDFARGYYHNAMEDYERAFALIEGQPGGLGGGDFLTNAGRLAERIGQHAHALEQYEHSQVLQIRAGNLHGQEDNLLGMGLVYLRTDRFDEAKEAFNKALALANHIDHQRGASYCYYGLGLTALAEGLFGQAEEYFQRSYEIRLRLGLKSEFIEDLSYMGRARLGLGYLDEALEVSEEALRIFGEHQETAGEDQEIYYNHFLILAEMGKPEAAQYLQLAYDAVMEQVEHVGNESAQKSFLRDVNVNRAVLSEAEREQWGIKHREGEYQLFHE